MAQSEEKKASRVKIRKKNWYKLIAPKLFGQREMGETYLHSPEEAKGRILTYNLKELTDNIKDQNVYLRFRIDKISGSNLETSVIGYRLTPSYVKRMVRKDTSRLDNYFTARTKDGKKVIVKGLMITIKKVQRSVAGQLRKQFQELLVEEISKSDFPTLMGNLVNLKIKANLNKRLSKIYPLREAAVRVLAWEEKEQGETPEKVKEEKEEQEIGEEPEKKEEQRKSKKGKSVEEEALDSQPSAPDESAEEKEEIINEDTEESEDRETG